MFHYANWCLLRPLNSCGHVIICDPHCSQVPPHWVARAPIIYIVHFMGPQIYTLTTALQYYHLVYTYSMHDLICDASYCA